jgi:hypothetical protein
LLRCDGVPAVNPSLISHCAQLSQEGRHRGAVMYGDTAVVQARERVRFRDETGEHWLTWHITDIWVRRSNQSRVVASHTSTLSNPTSASDVRRPKDVDTTRSH